MGPTRSLALHCARQALHCGCCRLLPSEADVAGVRCPPLSTGCSFLQDTRLGPALAQSTSGRPWLHRAGPTRVLRARGAPFWVLDAWVLPGQLGEARWQGPKASAPCLPATDWAGQPRLTRLSGLQSVYERQGIAVMTPTVPGSPKGPFLGLPRGTMRRQKSIGKQHGHAHRGGPGPSAGHSVTPRLPTGGQAPSLTPEAPDPLKLPYPLESKSKMTCDLTSQVSMMIAAGEGPQSRRGMAVGRRGSGIPSPLPHVVSDRQGGPTPPRTATATFWGSLNGHTAWGGRAGFSLPGGQYCGGRGLMPSR